MKAQEEDRFLRGRQIAYLIYEYFPGHWSQWFCWELCRPIYSCSSKWWYSGVRFEMGRNSIINDENPIWWHLGKLVQIKNTRVWEAQDRIGTVWPGDSPKESSTWLSQIEDDGNKKYRAEFTNEEFFEASQYYTLLELVDAVTRWVFSVPDLLQKVWPFRLRLGIWNVHLSWALTLPLRWAFGRGVQTRPSPPTLQCLRPRCLLSRSSVQRISKEYLAKLQDQIDVISIGLVDRTDIAIPVLREVSKNVLFTRYHFCSRLQKSNSWEELEASRCSGTLSSSRPCLNSLL